MESCITSGGYKYNIHRFNNEFSIIFFFGFETRPKTKIKHTNIDVRSLACVLAFFFAATTSTINLNDNSLQVSNSVSSILVHAPLSAQMYIVQCTFRSISVLRLHRTITIQNGHQHSGFNKSKLITKSLQTTLHIVRQRRSLPHMGDFSVVSDKVDSQHCSVHRQICVQYQCSSH